MSCLTIGQRPGARQNNTNEHPTGHQKSAKNRTPRSKLKRRGAETNNKRKHVPLGKLSSKNEFGGFLKGNCRTSSNCRGQVFVTQKAPHTDRQPSLAVIGIRRVDESPGNCKKPEADATDTRRAGGSCLKTKRSAVGSFRFTYFT